MPSSYTTRIRLEKQADGENANTWGLRLNDNVIDLVDEAIAGFEKIDVSAATSIELTNLNGQTDQSRNFGLEFVGAISADVTVTMPAEEKIYFVRNNTSGDFNLMFKNTGGTAVTGVGQGLSMILATNGVSITTMEEADPALFASVSALTATSAALQSDIDANSTAIAAVSALVSTVSATMATSINNANVTRAATSSTLNSRITSVSNNTVQTGTSVSFTKIKVSTGPLTVQTVSGTGVNFLTPAGQFCGRVQAQATGSDLQVVINDSDGGGEFEIINDSNDALFRVQGETGTVTNKSGVYGTISDQAIKTSVTQLTGSLDKISNIQGSKFTRIGLAGKQVGFVAQNIQPHIPEVVMNQPCDDGLLSVNTMGLIPFLVEAVKELKAKVSVLENN